MAQMGRPTIFCHDLVVEGDRIVGYRLRLDDQKREAVRAFRRLNFTTLAAGDSYNDTRMLLEADYGALFRPPANVVAEFPQLPVAADYDALARLFEQAGARLEGR